MCCSSNNKNKQKRSVNIRVLFRIGSKWNPIQPSTLQKYHQFTVFRNLKKNESCVTRVGQRPTHAIGALNNFPFAGCIAISLSHAVQWKRMPKKFRNREFTFAISRLAVSAAFGIFENCFWISCVPFLVSVTLSHSVRWHCSSCSESKWEIDTEIENEKNEKSGQDEACKHSAYIQHRDSRCNNFFGKSPRFPVMGLIVLPLFVA